MTSGSDAALLAGWPLAGIVAVFLAAALVIGLAGVRLARVADRLADVTGLGEAIFGAVLLGGSTSLPGIVTSVATAWDGFAEIAVSNAIGGIAAQTTFLAVADIAYRRANLEHAAASIENLLQGALLIALLAVPLMARSAPAVTVWSVHPASLAIVVGYVLGVRLVARTRSEPLWAPAHTEETREDAPATDTHAHSAGKLWAAFALLALVTAGAGYAVAESGVALAQRTGISETIVGGLLTAVATSLPELVTAIAAVRQGALTLAVGGVIGGNCFDVLFLSFADVAYRPGSVYHAATSAQVFVIALAILQTSTLLLGLLRREKSGIANIGFESFLILVLYFGGFAWLFLS